MQKEGVGQTSRGDPAQKTDSDPPHPVRSPPPPLSVSLTKSLRVANASAPYRGQNPENRKKEVFGVRKQRPGFFCQKISILYRAAQGKWGFSDSKRPFLGRWKWEFFDPKPSLPDFRDFRRRTRSQPSKRV